MQSVHFWTLRDLADVDDWDPDTHPDAHQSGYSHTFLELYVRLRSAGDPVSIGPSVPRRSAVVVVSLEELTEWHRHGLPRMTLALARQLVRGRPGVAVIRNDLHPHIASPQTTTLELMPTHASVVRPTSQRALPLLPQRGLTARSERRPPRVSTVAIKAYTDNVPPWTDALSRELQAQGVALRIDDQNHPSARGWGDFEDVDVALCTQLDDTLGDPRRKPATKLVNAWAAHVIPICEPRVAYLELATAGVDAVFASGPTEIAAAVRRLNEDEAQVIALLEASVRRGAELSVDRTLDAWRQALGHVPRTNRTRMALDALLARTQIVLGERVASAVRRRLPLPNPPLA